MTSLGPITWRTPSSVTAPSGAMGSFLGSVSATRGVDTVPVSAINVPDFFGVMVSDGSHRLRHVVAGTVYGTGLLPSATAPTVAATGARATGTLTAGTNPSLNNGEIFSLIGKNFNFVSFYFVTTLQTYGTTWFQRPQILIGANDQATIVNIQKMLNGTGVNGVDYWDPFGPSVVGNGVGDYLGIEVSSVSATVCTFRAIAYGTGGNAYRVIKGANDAGNTFSVATFSGGTNPGTSSIPIGTYRYSYGGWRDADGAASAISPVAEVTLTQADTVALSVLTANEDTTADYTKVYRSTKGGYRQYLNRSIARAGTTATDDMADTTLVDFGAVAYDERLYRGRWAGYPEAWEHLCYHLGTVWGAGARIFQNYSAGTAAVTNASPTVTITTGVVSPNWIGRYYQTASTTEQYLIVNAVASTGVLTLGRNYAGATNPTASYTVKDLRDPYTLAYAVPGAPNQWPATRQIGGVTGGNGVGITGLSSMWERLNIFTLDGVWQLTGTSPSSFNLRQVVYGAGCLNGRGVVPVNGRLFWLGTDGIYEWAGSGEPLRISKPPVVGGQVTGIHATIQRIHLAHRNWVHAHHDEAGQLIRWFVPLDTDTVPGHAIVLDLQTGAFSLETVPQITSCATVVRKDGTRIVLAGSLSGDIYQLDTGQADGAYGFVPLQTLTGTQTVHLLTVTGTPFPTTGNGLKGATGLWKSSTGAVEAFTVASNTNATLRLLTELSSTPAAGDQIMVGGIPMEMTTGDFDLGVTDAEKVMANLYLDFVPDSGELWVGRNEDGGTYDQPYFDTDAVDLSTASGHARVRWDGRGRLNGLTVQAVEPGCRPTIRRVAFDVRARSRARGTAS